MKISRLMEIVILLLNKKTVTAGELARRFGVSVRTIYRDIDELSTSGIPVYTSKGAGGGISILDDYCVGRAIISDSERDSILLALNTLKSTRYPEVDTVISKISGVLGKGISDWIDIDFTPWGADPNSRERLSDIKNAILRNRIITIEYRDSKNQFSSREVEPLRLMFKSQSWYLEAFCHLREGMRMFRLSRIRKIYDTGRIFDRPAALQKKTAENHSTPPLEKAHVKLRFTSDALFRLYDDFNEKLITKDDDGKYTVYIDVEPCTWFFGYVAGFGSAVTIEEPEWMRNNFIAWIDRIRLNYTDTIL